jgi:hypothetical protein
MIEFDVAKDAANIAKHGISLARAAEMQVVTRVLDTRFEERRFRAYGFLDGRMYCLAYTLRSDVVRAISLRRARTKEYRQYVP